ncbi:hypothetical protein CAUPRSCDRAFT_10482 [Caulochytrium protostelioides]|uniref:Secreted protein n=1 Tax=Caulochytrium protostelioides TaxID=1555241 RepID=A0A4P9WYT0_9FUNG|nr:hypothetical protein CAUPRSCDRAFT_10482 [Caulochytrium protostelioides]
MAAACACAVAVIAAAVAAVSVARTVVAALFDMATAHSDQGYADKGSASIPLASDADVTVPGAGTVTGAAAAAAGVTPGAAAAAADEAPPWTVVGCWEAPRVSNDDDDDEVNGASGCGDWGCDCGRWCSDGC